MANNSQAFERYMCCEWVAGADGPDSYDCWGLFRQRQKDYGRSIPKIHVPAGKDIFIRKLFNSHPESKNWTETKTPKAGDAVLMTQKKQYHHIGTYEGVLDGLPRFLHAVEKQGVILSSEFELERSGYKWKFLTKSK